MRCAITDLAGSGLNTLSARKTQLRAEVRRWAEDGVDFVQLREKQLESGDLLSLAETAMQVLGEIDGQRRAQLLVNGRPDIAAAAGAHGVHLASNPGELSPSQVRRLFAAAKLEPCTVSISCHTVEQVRFARDVGADLVLFGPIFEKRAGGTLVAAGAGLPALEEACAAAGAMPVLALGGVNATNLASCMEAGAAGFAAIRFFRLAREPGRGRR